jgi:Na+-translocating ferredoxin:NAD+ oxidoreductase subunit A
LLWCIHSFILAPLNLDSLDVLFFALLVVPLLKFLARASSFANGSAIARLGTETDELMIGSLVFGVALIHSNGGYSLAQAAAGSAASGLGYWLATALLESIRERLELSDLPAPFRGGPAMLISAGLIALAFMGFDSAFVRGIAG